MMTSSNWNIFPRYWPYVRGIHRHKGLWRGALMFSVKCVWIKSWINNREAGDLRRDRAHYDVMNRTSIKTQHKYHNMLNPPIKRCFSNETFENQHKIVQSYRITFIFIQDATSVTEFKSLLSKWTESTFQCGCSIFMSTLNYFNNYDDVIMTMLASQITSLPVVCSIVYSDVNQRKHQSSASLAFVREIHRGPVNFPHKWPVTRKMFPFDDVIM